MVLSAGSATGKKQLVEHQGRSCAVDQEIVPLNGSANYAGDDHALDFGSVGCRAFHE
jgi:hypothetical protein